jgi:maltose O-acetyltransferase
MSREQPRVAQQPDPADQRSMRERMPSGDLYIADDPQLAADNLPAMRLLEGFNGSSADASGERQRLLRELLGTLGEGAVIRPPLYCDYGYQTHLGARSFANFGLVVLDVARISIGEDVQIGPNVQLLTATHPWRRSCAVRSGKPPSRSRLATMCGWVAGSSCAPA